MLALPLDDREPGSPRDAGSLRRSQFADPASPRGVQDAESRPHLRIGQVISELTSVEEDIKKIDEEVDRMKLAIKNTKRATSELEKQSKIIEVEIQERSRGANEWEAERHGREDRLNGLRQDLESATREIVGLEEMKARFTAQRDSAQSCCRTSSSSCRWRRASRPPRAAGPWRR